MTLSGYRSPTDGVKKIVLDASSSSDSKVQKQEALPQQILQEGVEGYT
jgi:hypothetical protein